MLSCPHICRAGRIAKGFDSMTIKRALFSCMAFLSACLVPAYSQATGGGPTVSHVISASGFGGYAGVAAPGSWIEIYGTNLAGTTRQWTAADFTNNGTSAPTTIDGVTVTIGKNPAYISYVSPTQINVQVPNEPTGGTSPVVVNYNGHSSAPVQVTFNAQEPGLLAPPAFSVNGVQYAVAIDAATGNYVSNGKIPGTTATPANPGDTLTFYGTGFGAVPGVTFGTVASGQATLTGTFTMTIGNLPATVLYAGIAPGNVGLYQFNVVVPSNISGGDQLVQYSVGGSTNSLQTLYLSISGPVVPGLPSPPTNITVAPGNGSVSISFAASQTGGGPVITLYTATCTANGQSFTGTASSSPVVVSGLTNGTAYACSVTATSSAGTSNPSSSVLATPGTSGGGGGGGNTGTFTLTSSAGVNGGTYPATYSCDGTGSTLPLAWTNPPSGTQSYAVLLSTNVTTTPLVTKYDWVLYNIPAATTSLAQDSFLVGTTLQGDDGPGNVYDPPCSTGPGAKAYTWTIYALSGNPTVTVPPGTSSATALLSAIAPMTLGSASITLSYSRSNATATGACMVAGTCLPAATLCQYIKKTLQNAKDTGTTPAVVSCDGTYAYIASIDYLASLNTPADQAMTGITSTNLQIPTPQNFQGAYGWKIPENPQLCNGSNANIFDSKYGNNYNCTARAGSFIYTTVASGPIGVAINGIPIFNPCVQTGNCTATNGDTKGEGQLDNCNGHSGRSDDYHYHAAPVCLMAEQSSPNYWNQNPVGWMLDGYAIFGLSNADGSTPTRDACGGSVISGAQIPNGYPYTYAYHVINSFPYITNNCMSGVASPDLPNATCGPSDNTCTAKYHPFRQPPVNPFNDTNMTMTTASDGYIVLQFTSANPFTTTETGQDSYPNSAGTYRIRYIQLTGSALASQLAQKQNSGKTACWNFEFQNVAGTQTQPSIAYCR